MHKNADWEGEIIGKLLLLVKVNFKLAEEHLSFDV